MTSVFSAALWAYLSLNASLSAEPCTPFRLDAPGKPLSEVPVMDQDGKGICYAYAASQLVDAYRFSHGDKRTQHITSPIAAAVFYTAQDTNTNTSIDAGNLDSTINSMRKSGSCDHHILFNSLEQQHNLDSFFSRLTGFYRQKKRASKQRVAESIKDDLCAYGVEKPEIPDLNKIINLLNTTDDQLAFLRRLFKDIRKKNTLSLNDIPKPNVGYTGNLPWEKRPEVTRDRVNRLLNKNPPQPVGIRYCKSLYFNSRSTAMNRTVSPDYTDDKNCGAHISAIIGRRLSKNGRCEFLIRNSWGSSCNYYHQDWDCEEGQVWMDYQALAKQMDYLFWLE